MARLWLRLCAVLAILSALCTYASVNAQTPDPRREQARALASSGKIADALALYDALTASGSTDVTLYGEAASVAKAAGDMKRLGLYSERQVKIDPGNAQLRMLAPLAYQVAGDDADALRLRQDYLAFRKASSDPKINSQSFFMIDRFRVGAYMVNALECPEIGGKFGIGYIFDVFGPKDTPLTQEEMLPNHREKIVVEHDRATIQVAKELGQPAPAATLDVLSAGQQALLKMFTADPSYSEVRALVVQNITADTGLAAKPPMNGAWGRLGCEAADK